MTEDIVLGGIEGGATHSKVVLYNSKGEKLVQCSGPGTNHWIDGMDECQNRIHKMVEEAKKEAGIPLSKPLAALGMSLSGCEQEETNLQLQQGLLEKFPTLSEKYVVCSDTVGSIAAAHQHGGVVLIAGTGSNGLLLNPDGSVSRCGGWGHLMGDEGGAWWISHKAIKVYFDEQDNLADPPYSTNYVWEAIKKHFNVKNRFDLLEHCYSNFDKPTFAGLCKSLAEGAKQGDPLCLWLFSEAGVALAQYILALVPTAHPTLKNAPGGLPVVCVGSVWLSWDYLRPGFIKTLGNLDTSLALLRLTTSMAVGATYLAAQAIDFDMPRDYKNNYQVFFYFNPDKMNCKCQVNGNS